MSDDDYEVGYGKPPKHSRFVPGESGNKGRRKKPPETQAAIVARIRDEIVVVDGKPITKFEIAVQSVFNQTVRRGNPRELKVLLELLDKYGALSRGDAYAQTKADAEKVMEKISQTVERLIPLPPGSPEHSAIESFAEEEVRLVMCCPTCSPALRQQWHTADRKRLAERGMRTPLQRAAEDIRKK